MDYYTLQALKQLLLDEIFLGNGEPSESIESIGLFKAVDIIKKELKEAEAGLDSHIEKLAEEEGFLQLVKEAQEKDNVYYLNIHKGEHNEQ